MEKFGDWQSTPVGLESTWKTKKEVSQGSTQTELFQTQETGIQSHSSATVETQTVEVAKHEPELNPYPPSLYAFLAKVVDPMCEALQENLSPFNVRFSDDFYGRSEADERNVENEAKKLHELRSPTAPSNFFGSCISWSPSGNQIAVGYSCLEHDHWCTHSTPISIWNLIRLKADDDEKNRNTLPHKEILFNSCSTALSFHPKDGNLLAVGFYSGELELIDINASNSGGTAKEKLDETGKRVQSGNNLRNQELIKIVDSSCHYTQIVGIQWVSLTPSQTAKIVQKNPSPSHYFILSASTDGMIGIWSINKIFTRVFLERKYVAFGENLPDNITISKRTKARVKEIGVTALSICKDDPTVFVFATYGCMIFQGDLLTEIEINDPQLKARCPPKETAPIMSAVTTFVTEQVGYINSIDCSPYNRDLILSSTLTGHVLLQNIFQSTPTLQFYTDEQISTDVKWSGRPMMFGVAEGNKLSLIDLMVDKTKPTLVALHNDKLRALAFEKTGTGFVATTDEKGLLHIWELPKSISSHQFTELDALIQLGQITTTASTTEIEPPSSKIV